MTFGQITKLVHQKLCPHAGHMVRVFERGRYFLECGDCGAQSPGWDVGAVVRDCHIPREPPVPLTLDTHYPAPYYQRITP